MKNLKRVFPILLMSSLLIGCSDVKTLRADFKKYENQVTYADFYKHIENDFIHNSLISNVPFNDQYNLDTGIILTGKLYEEKTIKGTDVLGVNLDYVSKTSSEETFKYDHETKVSLHESNSVTETTSKNVSSLDYEILDKDDFNIIYTSSSGYEKESSEKTSSLDRLQYDSETTTIYDIDQINKTYTARDDFNPSYETVDTYFAHELNVKVSLVVDLFFILYGIAYEPAYYIDNDGTLLTMVLDVENTYTEDKDTFTIDELLKVQIDLPTSTFNYSYETTLTKKGEVEDITLTINSYMVFNIEYKGCDVVKADLSDFTYKD